MGERDESERERERERERDGEKEKGGWQGVFGEEIGVEGGANWVVGQCLFLDASNLSFHTKLLPLNTSTTKCEKRNYGHNL